MNIKRNSRYKSRGSILVITALAAIVWIFIAQSLFIVGAGGFGMIKSSRVALQAQQYAEIEVDRLKNVAYENLDSDGAHSRQVIANIQESGWEDEVSIGPENTISGSDDVKQRIATVNVYKSGDTLPRFTLEVPLSSQSSNLSQGLEELESNTLTFTPEVKYSDFQDWSGKVAYHYFIETTGVINVTYNQGYNIIFDGKKGKINLGNQSISNKESILTGGYASGKQINKDDSVTVQAANYIKNNLDKFKQLAIQQIPEAVNATNIVVKTPVHQSIMNP